jgi:hypothetical protein
MTFEIAVGSADDVQRMARWAADEGWNPGKTDAHAFFAADPGGFLVGRLNGEPVTCISVVKYGQGFGFLGFYIARPGVRGKGYGIQTWNAGMKRLAGRNVGLDGVVAQQANYRKSGFRLAWNNVRYEGAPMEAEPPAGVQLLDARSVSFDKLAAYDRRFFPEARDSFLASWISLPERTAMAALRDGALGAAAVAVDIAGVNKGAVAWAEGLGLRPSFETARMYTGPDPAIDSTGLYGVASFELG